MKTSAPPITTESLQQIPAITTVKEEEDTNGWCITTNTGLDIFVCNPGMTGILHECQLMANVDRQKAIELVKNSKLLDDVAMALEFRNTGNAWLSVAIEDDIETAIDLITKQLS